MLSFLPAFVIAPLHFCLQVLNLMFWAIVVMTMGLVKALLPFAPIRQRLNLLLNRLEQGFCLSCGFLLTLFNHIHWDIQVEGELKPEGWYLVMANHQSWFDIIVLMWFSVGRMPPPKFFIKQQLFWVPFLGWGAWALDMPFMRRYSREFLQKHPHLQGKDIETTRKSCERFRLAPTTVVNFVEGTRYTPKKHRAKQSPFAHLLPPKAGGTAFTLATMGDMLEQIVNITFIYPQSREQVLLDAICGRLKQVIIRVEMVPVTAELLGDYVNDDQFRRSFQAWLNRLWQDKDHLIKQHMIHGR